MIDREQIVKNLAGGKEELLALGRKFNDASDSPNKEEIDSEISATAFDILETEGIELDEVEREMATKFSLLGWNGAQVAEFLLAMGKENS